MYIYKFSTCQFNLRTFLTDSGVFFLIPPRLTIIYRYLVRVNKQHSKL
jgi:hypothetical protein